MRKFILPALLVMIAASLQAQVPEDVLKYSWQPVNGTARIQAIGGAMGSLGGDITATFVNPAGIGFFKTRDLVFSPGMYSLKNKGTFRGTSSTEEESKFNLGPTGFVGGWPSSGRWTSHAISVGVSRTANFANKIFYTGKNDFSSFAEQYASEAAGSGFSLDEILNSNSVSLGTRMAVYGFLIDTATLGNNSNPDLVSLAMYDQLKNGGAFLVNQSHEIETKGGITELAFAYAANMDDKLFLGGSIGIPIVTYEKTSRLREEDATGNASNYFDFAELEEKSGTNGIGVNLKLGIILKPADQVRLGLAVHSPSFFSLKDTYEATLMVNTENYRTNPGTETITSGIFTNNEIPEYEYELNSPWKFLLSGSYVLREVADVRKQRGFLTADVEYVTHTTNHFWQASSYANATDQSYYKGVNSSIKDYYKGALNFRVGGELKFTTIMTRLGFAYYGSPYRDKELKANKMFLSGGLGYRHAGFFVDLTYVYGIQKDISFPYRLPDKANTFANIKSTGGNMMLGFGFKF